MNKKEITAKIKSYSKDLGFDLTGITSSEKVEDFNFYKSWIENGYAADMEYLKRNCEKRESPEILLPGTKSIICLGLNYYYPMDENREYKIARYALGEDYHIFFKNKINELFEYINKLIPNVEGRVYVDTAPVLERSLAKRAGLGWIGKNTMLINPKMGSYFYLGEVYLNIELEYDNPIKDYCGNCNKCITACPTNAIIEEGKIDSNLCISYLTIESRKEIPESITKKLDNNIFGCDICQDVCPWNKKFSRTSDLDEIKPRNWMFEKSVDNLLNINQEEFSTIFSKSAVKRSKLKGFLRNIIAFVSNNKEKYSHILNEFVSSEDEVLKKQAEYALKYSNKDL